MFWRKRKQSDFDDEIQAHLALEVARLQGEGMTPTEAEAAARRAFGNVASAQEHFYESSRWLWLEHIKRDLFYAVRVLLRSPGFTAVAVITLALGVGANAAIFSFVNAVLLKPLPYPHPEQIVSVWEKRPDGGSNPISTLNFLDWQRQNRCFQFLSAIAWDKVTLTGSGSPEKLNVHRVSASYFKVLGVGATLGRTFAASEDEVGNDREVVLSNRIWRSRFAGDPKVIGRKITLDAKNYTIIGVLPADSEFDRTWGVMWLPLAFTPANMSRNYHWLYATARLEPASL